MQHPIEELRKGRGEDESVGIAKQAAELAFECSGAEKVQISPGVVIDHERTVGKKLQGGTERRFRIARPLRENTDLAQLGRQQRGDAARVPIAQIAQDNSLAGNEGRDHTPLSVALR